MSKTIEELLGTHNGEGNRTKGDTWKALRQAVLKRDGYVCQECGGKANSVHHKQYGMVWESDLISLCTGCHLRAHGLEPELIRPTKRRLKELKAEVATYDGGLVLPSMTDEARWLLPDIKVKEYWSQYLRPYYINQILELENQLKDSKS